MAQPVDLRLTRGMARGDQGSSAQTSAALVNAAVNELLAVGQAEFAMERVARGAFFSVGSVYERWRDRDELLADIGRDPIASGIAEGITAQPDAPSTIEWVLGPGLREILLGGEILLAGQTMPGVRESSLTVWHALSDSLGQRLPPSMAWYVATYAVGNALLDVIDVKGPSPPRGRVEWFMDACASEVSAPRPGIEAVPPGGVDIPQVPPPTRTDAVALALIGAARELLQERGASGASTRDIAAGAGVTTGAMYRRYQGKSKLLADVLLAELEPDRYTWTWDLVRALASNDPYGEAARVVADRMVSVAEDEPAQRVLLQVGIAARSDPALRAQIVERVRIAHAARVEMVQHFIEVGLLRGDVSAGVFAWGFQAIPVGVRATLPLGIPLDRETSRAAISALLAASADRE